MSFGGRDHVLDAIVDHLHRASGLHCQQRRVPGEDRWIFFLATKAAAGLRLHDANVRVAK